MTVADAPTGDLRLPQFHNFYVLRSVVRCDGPFTNVDVARVHRDVVAASAELQAATVDDELALSTRSFNRRVRGRFRRVPA